MFSKKNPKFLSTDWLRDQLAALIPDIEEKHLKLAYSGGMDSHVLLQLLVELCADSRRQFTAIHVDHGLSPQSREWSRHCAAICSNIGVPLIVERVSVEVGGKGPEDAAREARYHALTKHILPNDVLVTAHHRDDQVETVLLHLVRGTGAHGLAGMAPVREFAQGMHIRPLLERSRRQIEDYARSRNLRWVDDASNKDTSFSRNYMRHEIVPKLRAHWPGAERVIGRSAGHAAAAVELLEQIAAEDWKRCGLTGVSDLNLNTCNDLGDARLRNLLRFWVFQSGLALPATRHIDEVVRQIRKPSATGHAIICWPGATFCRYRDRLTLQPHLETIVNDYDIEWDTARSMTIAVLGVRVSAIRAKGRGLSAARLNGVKVHLRNRRGGEALQPVGRAHHHKLKKLFQEAGIPPWQRDQLPLVYINNNLAAVGDRWVSQEFAAEGNEAGLELKISKLG
ncbi:MAG: tRNA lysidine(34) synthetase TilS [Acidiferrobacterales bacterium]